MTIIIQYPITTITTGWDNIVNKPLFFEDLLITNPQENDILTFDGSHWINNQLNYGTVTSVAITSSILTITNSPVTTDGTIAIEIDDNAISISKINGLNTALNNKLNTGATTADIVDSENKRYVNDAQLTVINNTSGTNTGDQEAIAVNFSSSGGISSTNVQGAIEELDTELGIARQLKNDSIFVPILAPTNASYLIAMNEQRAYTVNSLTAKTTGTLTCNLTISIGGGTVTGLDTIAITTSETTTNATGTNSLAIGDDLSAIVSSTTGSGQLYLSVNITYI